MKYFLVTFIIGILCQNTLARGLDNPVLNDFERRLVRLEERQFSESENLEHRMLRLETKLGAQGEEKLEVIPLEGNLYEISEKETPAEGMTFLQRLEKVEKNWERALEEQLAKFSSKYENLSERISAIEEHLQVQFLESLNTPPEESNSTPPEESNSTPPEESKSDNSEEFKFLVVGGKSYYIKNDEKVDGYDTLESIEKHEEEQFLEGLNTPPEESKSDNSEELKFQVVGGKSYYIENDEKADWYNAWWKCHGMNAHLVSLQDEEEWSALKEALSQDNSYWTDIYGQSVENKFISESSGRNAPFLMWYKGEPNSLDDIEDCVELRADYGHKMNDIVCLEPKNFICERNF